MNNFDVLQKIQEETNALVKNYFTDNGGPDQRYFENRLCPVCAASENTPLFANCAGYRYVRCTVCGMVFMNPVLRQELVEALYLNSKEKTAKHQLWEDSVKRFKPADKPVDSERFDLLLKYSNRGALLDFGCGFGKMADRLKFFFDTVEGIEIDPYCSEQAEKIYNIKVYNDFIENLQLNNKYDVCFSYNNIEHLYDPKKILAYLYKSLKKNGIIFIECPNACSLSVKIFKNKHHLVQGNEHINMFSMRTLSKLLSSAGFTPIACKTRNLDINSNDLLIYMFKRKEFYHRCSSLFINNRFYSYAGGLADRLSAKLFKKMKSVGFGSYIQIVARKNNER